VSRDQGSFGGRRSGPGSVLYSGSTAAGNFSRSKQAGVNSVPCRRTSRRAGPPSLHSSRPAPVSECTRAARPGSGDHQGISRFPAGTDAAGSGNDHRRSTRVNNPKRGRQYRFDHAHNRARLLRGPARAAHVRHARARARRGCGGSALPAAPVPIVATVDPFAPATSKDRGVETTGVPRRGESVSARNPGGSILVTGVL